MAPLVVLLLTFATALLVERARRGRWAVGPAGRLAACVMFVFTGVSHFFMVAPMAAMVPRALPAPEAIVIVTGVLEILGGVGLLVPRTRRAAAWALAIFLVAVLPANVHAALERVPLGGHADGPSYLWFRVPLQALFLAWVLRFGLWSASRDGGEGGGPTPGT